MANDATFYQNPALVRSGEVPSANWTNGLNRGGSNAPGVGIGTAVTNLDESLPNWTLLDQFGAARGPQDSQHLGQAGGVPINVADAVASDFNDTVSLTDLAAGWTRNTVV